ALDKIKDQKVLNRIEASINKVEAIDSIKMLSNTRKLTGYSSYYRIKGGDYRIGFELINDSEVCLSRHYTEKKYIQNFLYW
ncbi:MAG: type II toxin-antitoxin system RelE family toxin, partial [Bacteroidia bacterium]